jgi:hypothetical protein
VTDRIAADMEAGEIEVGLEKARTLGFIRAFAVAGVELPTAKDAVFLRLRYENPYQRDGDPVDHEYLLTPHESVELGRMLVDIGTHPDLKTA